MKIYLKRTGGLAGIAKKWELDEQRLDPHKAAELKKLLKEADFFALPGALGGPNQARDAFIYELTVELEGRKRTVICCEETAGAPLRRCLELIARVS